MTRKERLLATMRGETVDRPAVNFYEIGGFIVNPEDKDPYNVYNSPDWRALLEMADNQTDIIRMMSPVRQNSHMAWEHDKHESEIERYLKSEEWEEGDSRFHRITYEIKGRKLTALTRRQKHLDTIWTTEHLIKDREDVLAYLDLPDEVFSETFDCAPLFLEDKKLGDRGLVMIDTEDPVCAVASLFPIEEFALFAFMEADLCHKLLEKHARIIQARTEKISELMPGFLWRIYGPEYVTPPFFPANLFDDYVVKYDAPMIEAIHANGGFARVHVHGNVKEVIPAIVDMGADAIDPLEPPPHGNLELAEARKLYGDKLVLFGNIEIADIENMPTDQFRKVVQKSIEDGTRGEGRGFVLMPSASPYGRDISDLTLANYSKMVNQVMKTVIR